MRILERFVRGKRPDPGQCEDVIVATADFVAVIDGATDKTNREFRGRCGGRFAAETLAHAFEQMPADADLHACVTRLTADLRLALVSSAAPVDLERDDAPSAVFVAYSARRREVWRVGDGSWRIGDESHCGDKAVDVVAAGMRSALLHALLLEGEPPDELMRNDPGRQMILPLLRHQYRLRNSEDPRFGYGALDGRPVPERFLEVRAVPPGTEVVLASDGYPCVLGTLSESEAYLDDELARDPMRIGRHCETKGLLPGHASFDDRAYLRIAT
jgi:hypothetical protein